MPTCAQQCVRSLSNVKEAGILHHGFVRFGVRQMLSCRWAAVCLSMQGRVLGVQTGATFGLGKPPVHDG